MINKRDFMLFMLVNALLGITQSIDISFFNNFINDTFHLPVTQRTMLEIPREFPGFAVVFVSTLLLALGDVRMAAAANSLAAVGMLGLGMLSSEFNVMMVWLLIYSMGQHLFMPLTNSIAMNLSDTATMGKRLGQLNGANTLAFLVANATFALFFKDSAVKYSIVFIAAALAFLLSAFLLLKMTPHAPKQKKKFKLLFRKEYTLFYILNILFGARKQIFITFAPWVLIKIFNQGVSTFAMLGFIVAGIGIFFKPYVGHLIDRLGERFVLAGEAIILIFVCIGYGFSQWFFGLMGKDELAFYAILACFVVDQLLNAAGMARATYIRKIAVVPEDVSPTLAMGTSIDHILSMTVPWVGGIIWISFGYEYVFLGGACIALLNLLATSRIRVVKPMQQV